MRELPWTPLEDKRLLPAFKDLIVIYTVRGSDTGVWGTLYKGDNFYYFHNHFYDTWRWAPAA